MITLYRWPSLDPVNVYSQQEAEVMISDHQCILEEEKIAYETEGTIPVGFPQPQAEQTNEEGSKDDGSQDQGKSSDDPDEG